MGNETNLKIGEFWRAKKVLTGVIVLLGLIAFLTVMSNNIIPWMPWVFIIAAWAIFMYDMKHGSCPHCKKYIKTTSLSTKRRFSFCPYCAGKLSIDSE